MKNMVVLSVLLAAAPLCAVTIGPNWCVAYPEPGTNGDNFALKAAAEEIARDIKEATGLELKVLRQSWAKPPAIYVGGVFAEKAGFDLSGYEWWDNAIAEKGGSIYLFGRDRMGRDQAKMNSKYPLSWFYCVLPSARAAARFLETSVGVRFLMPGEVGKEVPKRGSVSLADGAFDKEKPQQIYGSGRTASVKDVMHYVANGIWGMGAFHSYGGHTYPDACPNKLFRTHPEYFALINGKRLCGETGQAALCISNPAVEELIVAELKKQFDLGADVCQLAQQDGAKVCQCEKCRAMYGTGDDWGEKFWCFHRHIAERMLKERPGKILHIINYGATATPPKTFKAFPSNVMVEMCRYGEEEFKAWKGYTVPHGFTVYTYLAGAYQVPGFVARHPFSTFAKLAKRFRANKVRGVFRCGGVGDLYGTEGPGYYMFHKMLLDDSLDQGKLVAEYCNAAFGPASALMMKFYETQDARLKMRGVNPKNPLDIHGYVFSPDAVSVMENCLSRAEKTAGLSDKQRKRLELVRIEFDYAKNMGAISTLYSAYKLRPSKASIAPLVDELKRRNAILDGIFQGKNRPRKIDGWPEMQLFGHDCTRSVMKVNGILGAPIGAPLTWPLETLGDILPGVGVKEGEALRSDAPPTFAEFSAAGGWNELGGISMEKVSVKARFKAVYDANALYLLVEGDLPDEVEAKDLPHDGPVWNDDVVDVMVAPGDTRDICYHLIYGVNPSSRYDDATGLVNDPLDPMFGKSDVTWNGKGWKTESQREGGKWRSIMTLPYSDFCVAAPKPGDSWFVNVGRMAKTGKDRQEDILLLWSPNVESRSFVALNAMGKLIFK